MYLRLIQKWLQFLMKLRIPLHQAGFQGYAGAVRCRTCVWKVCGSMNQCVNTLRVIILSLRARARPWDCFLHRARLNWSALFLWHCHRHRGLLVVLRVVLLVVLIDLDVSNCYDIISPSLLSIHILFSALAQRVTTIVSLPGLISLQPARLSRR